MIGRTQTQQCWLGEKGKDDWKHWPRWVPTSYYIRSALPVNCQLKLHCMAIEVLAMHFVNKLRFLASTLIFTDYFDAVFRIRIRMDQPWFGSYGSGYASGMRSWAHDCGVALGYLLLYVHSWLPQQCPYSYYFRSGSGSASRDCRSGSRSVSISIISKAKVYIFEGNFKIYTVRNVEHCDTHDADERKKLWRPALFWIYKIRFFNMRKSLGWILIWIGIKMESWIRIRIGIKSVIRFRR